MSDREAMTTEQRHIGVLDGVRALSILLVLFGHMVPLGPKVLQLNEAAASMGMALFFILSGFLITRLLLENNNLVEFLIKRFARIVPLAYMFAAAVFVFFNRDLNALAHELTFSLNYDKGAITAFNPHLWSLCVEVQFYLLMGLLFRLFRAPAPFVIVGLCLTVTVLKVIAQDPYSMQTHLRGDELLAGSVLCLSLKGRFGDHAPFWRAMERLTPGLVLLLILCSRPGTGPLDYIRAYAAALLVGSVIFTRRAWLADALCSKPMAYIAKVSYAVYVIHIGAAAGIAAVLGTPSKLMLYLVQRPLMFIITFTLAHLSTFYYEAPWNALGRQVIVWRRRGAAVLAAPQSAKA